MNGLPADAEIGTLNPATGISTTFAATSAGTGVINADHASLIDDATGAMTVNAGALSNVKIIEGAAGNGPELTTKTLTTDQTLTVHAAGYDAAGNYLGDLSVDWSVSGNIGTLSPVTGAKTVFTARTAGSGAITASHVALIEDKTGVITVDDPTVKVESSPLGDGLPQNFQLWQNYPNPFHAGITATQIHYELPSRSLLNIAVYNLSGQLLRVLFDGQQNAGRYAVAWDGKILTGEPAPSGVYFVRLEAGQFVMARKIMVMR